MTQPNGFEMNLPTSLPELVHDTTSLTYRAGVAQIDVDNEHRIRWRLASVDNARGMVGCDVTFLGSMPSKFVVKATNVYIDSSTTRIWYPEHAIDPFNDPFAQDVVRVLRGAVAAHWQSLTETAHRREEAEAVARAAQLVTLRSIADGSILES